MDHPPIGTRWGSRSLNVAGIDGDPDGLVVCSLGQQGLDQDASQALHIDLPIFQGFIDTGPFPLKKGRQRQFRQRLGLAFTQESIGQIEQRIGSLLKTVIDLVTKLFQGGMVHLSKVPCFQLMYSNFTLFRQPSARLGCLVFRLV